MQDEGLHGTGVAMQDQHLGRKPLYGNQGAGLPRGVKVPTEGSPSSRPKRPIVQDRKEPRN